MKKALSIAIVLSLVLAGPLFAKKKEEAPAPVAETATHIAVPINVMNAITETLQRRPYAEVAPVLDAYKATAQMISIPTAPKEE